MDFIDLATFSHKFLRQLVTSGEDNDDDFVKLENLDSTGSAGSSNAASGGGNLDGSRPLLSPSMEAELYLLATNFLLYVAMVIIATMVAKIYFPQSLEVGQSYPMSRSISYKRINDAEQETSSSYYSSDASDDEDDGGCDEKEEDDAAGLLLELEHDVTMNKHKKKKRSSRKDQDSNTTLRKNYNFLEFDQSKSTRSDVLQSLVFCIVMLNFTFVTWGVLQERMLTRRYPRFTGEYFTYSYALVFTNRFWTLIMSGLLLLYLKPRQCQSTVLYEYSFPSISNMLSSWCQYEALRYVSFPAVTLFKSFKLAPVMAMGKILGNKQYPQYDYVVALMIGIGITMFMSSTDDLAFGSNIYEEKSNAIWTGIMLLFLFLFFDSFTSQWQSRMFQRHSDLSMIELMFATSAFSTVLALVTLIHTKELGPALSFVYRHSEIHLHFFMFSICSTMGQLFIFYTIKNFGAVIFTLIMTTRVLLSIALSCILYGHEVSSTGFFGLMIVMGAVCYRVKRKAEGTRLLKWQGIDDDKAPQLVQEWHEHGEM